MSAKTVELATHCGLTVATPGPEMLRLAQGDPRQSGVQARRAGCRLAPRGYCSGAQGASPVLRAGDRVVNRPTVPTVMKQD